MSKPERAPNAQLSHISRVLEGPDGRSLLELQANIEGRDQKILLSLDEVRNYVSKDQEVAEELRGIRAQLERIEKQTSDHNGGLTEMLRVLGHMDSA